MPKNGFIGHKLTLGIISIHILIHSVLCYFSVSKNFRISSIFRHCKISQVGLHVSVLSPAPFLTSIEKNTQIFLDTLGSFSYSCPKRTIYFLRDVLSILCHFVTWVRSTEYRISIQ